MTFAIMKLIPGTILRLLASVADIAAPRTCLLCDRALTMDENAICLSCLATLPRTFYHLDPNNSIALAMVHHRRMTRAACWLFYNHNSRVSDLIHSIKYHDMPDVGRVMGRMFADELKDANFFDGVDALVPVPLHWLKRYRRHYNQSTVIARGIAEVTGIPIADALVARAHSAQARLDGERRRKNVTPDTFSVRHPEMIDGKNIVIVDDVTTTGTTLNCIATAILRDCPGVRRIDILTLGVASDI
ncbi:MAG: ComF family protein [Muribaculaceae bacterium]